MENPRHLNNQNLLDEIKNAIAEERKQTTRILHLLREIDSRKLYADRGFSSLFAFVTEFLGYSEAAAHRRISAMRAMREIPQVEEKLTMGKLSLTNLASAQVLFHREAKQAKPFSTSQKLKLLDNLENKSSRECQKIMAAISPQSIPSDKRRELTETKTEIRVVVAADLLEKLDRLKNLWAHQNPSMTDGDLISKMADLCLKRVDPLQGKTADKMTRRKFVPQNRDQEAKHDEGSSKTDLCKTPAPGFLEMLEQAEEGHGSPGGLALHSRYIPKRIRETVWERDNGRCQYVDPLTTRRCGSAHLIQIDHRQPWAMGGSSTTENL